MIVDGGFEGDGGFVGGDGGRGDDEAVGLDVDGINDVEEDVAVDAGAGVEAGGGLGGVIAADGDDVGFVAEVEVTCEVVLEADPTVGAMAEEEAVDVDVAVGHDAVELDEDGFGGGIGGESEVFAIPADARGDEGAAGAGGVVLVDGSFDAPIVGEIEGAPAGVGEVGLGGVFGIGAGEEPGGVEVLSAAGGDLGGGDGGGEEKEEGHQ